MGMIVYASSRAAVAHCSWAELAPFVPEVDALIVDAPYSERVHKGHDNGAAGANRLNGFSTGQEKDRRYAEKKIKEGGTHRKSIAFAHWTPEDVSSFVDTWAPKTRGWIVSLTDHILAPVWAAALERHGRYVFSPLACVEPGSRVRMGGDGPAQWSCWAVVARPRREPFSKWGALPGAYVVPPGQGRARKGRIAGGKPPWIMDRLVEHYSRPGDLVCDPCAGAGTTLTSAIRAGRRAVGCDTNEEHAKLSADAVRRAEEEGPRS